MIVIHARNVNEALTIGIGHVLASGIALPSRAGAVLEMPCPVATVYTRPEERVLLSAARDANPFFHLFESFHMLAGRCDVETLVYFNKRMAEYSDDGINITGSAYGYRWRHHFNFDQLEATIKTLKADPRTRRVVIQHWLAADLTNMASKDIPCNTAVFVDTRDGRLNIMVTCRSNDMIWGAYGANAVHFSILQEYLAARVGVPMGRYTQVSNNFHAYAENPVWKRVADNYVNNPGPDDPYDRGEVSAMPMFSCPQEADMEINFLMDSIHKPIVYTFRNQFLGRVAVPMLYAWRYWRDKRVTEAMEQIELIRAEDWRRACAEWLLRRQAKAA